MRTRGLLLAFQGLDKTGKTTQCNLLKDYLQSAGKNTQLLHFPMRKSSTGTVIDSYLKNKLDLSPQVSHLLFSANRWEFNTHIRDRLSEGAIVILDRYVWSGRAYSYALGLTSDWTDGCDQGLPIPDYILFLRSNSNRLKDQLKERYETTTFQEKVQSEYQKIIEKHRQNNIVFIDTDKSKEANHILIREWLMERVNK